MDKIDGMGDNSKYSILLYTIIAVIFVSPPLFSRTIFQLIMFLSMFLWLFLNIGKRFYRLNNSALITIIFIILSILKYYIDANHILNPRIIRLYYCCFFAISATLISNEIDKYGIIFWRVLLILPIWLIISICYGLTTPNLFRSMSGSGLVDTSFYYRAGVLGYGYIYGIVFCIPVFLGILSQQDKIKKWHRNLLIVNLSLDVIFIWMANYAIAFFSMPVGALLYYIKGMKNKTLSSFISFSLIVVSIAFMLNFEQSMKFLSSQFQESYYFEKIEGVYNSYDSYGIAYGRIDIWSNAVKSFFKSPFWGIGFSQSINTHSEILYLLVYYGLVIGGLGIYVLYIPFTLTKGGNLVKRVQYACVIVYTIILCLNPAGTDIGLLSYCFYVFGQGIIHRLEDNAPII